MKNKILLSLSAGVALVAGANTISWTIDGISAPADVENAQWQYVFLTQSGSGLTDTATDREVESETDSSAIYAQGTWTDSTVNDPTTKYVVALWDGVTTTGNRYYTFMNGTEYLTVTPGDFTESDPTSGSTSTMSGSIANLLSAGSVTVDGKTYSLSTTAVPEPSTAALALAGLALLIRRRK